MIYYMETCYISQILNLSIKPPPPLDWRKFIGSAKIYAFIAAVSRNKCYSFILFIITDLTEIKIAMIFHSCKNDYYQKD